MRISRIALLLAAIPAASRAAAADLLVTTIDRDEPVRGISLTADAQGTTIHSSDGPVVSLRTENVIQITATPAPTPPPEAARAFEVELVDGSRLRGVLAAGTPGNLTLRSRLLREADGKVEIPIEELWSLRRVAGAATPPASRMQRVPDQDVAYRLDGGRVTGVIAGFTPTGVLLDRGEGSTREIAFDQLAALHVDNERAAPVTGLQAVVRVAGGSAVLLGKDFRIGGGILEGSTASGVQVRVSTDNIAALGFRGGRFMHLSDLKPVEVRRTPHFPIPEGPDAEALLDFVCPLRLDRSPDNRPIHVGNQRYFKGLGVRPRTEISYDLGDGYSRFRSLCGIDDEVLGPGYGRGAGTGSVVFQVKLDGAIAHTSPIMRGGKPPHSIDLDVTGKSRLTLVVMMVPVESMPGKQEDSPELDNAVWARPLLIR